LRSVDCGRHLDETERAALANPTRTASTIAERLRIRGFPNRAKRQA
jgi:hypothetical protein